MKDNLIYYVMDRGDRQERIFLDDVHRQSGAAGPRRWLRPAGKPAGKPTPIA